MIVIQWAVTIFLWLVAAAFSVSDFLCVLALIHRRRDQEFALVFGVVILIFAMFAAMAAYAALAAGRCL